MEKAKITWRTSEHGRSKLHVECICGGSNSFYVWSWAGHGKAKCVRCHKWIRYSDLSVVDKSVNLL